MQTAGLCDAMGHLLCFRGAAEAAASQVDRRSRRPLGNIAAVQVDTGLDDAQGEEHQHAEQDGPLGALAEATLVTGPSTHAQILASWDWTKAVTRATITVAMATAPAMMIAVS